MEEKNREEFRIAQQAGWIVIHRLILSVLDAGGCGVHKVVEKLTDEIQEESQMTQIEQICADQNCFMRCGFEMSGVLL